jgi:hypothetical protein
MGETPGGSAGIGSFWAKSVEAVRAVPRIAVVRAELGRRKTRLLAGWSGPAGRLAVHPGRPDSIRLIHPRAASTLNETLESPIFLIRPRL